MTSDYNEQKNKLLELVRYAVFQDKELREKYQIGDKFRFIRDRLTALLANVEESLIALEKEITQNKESLKEDEILVYVYLFNAQGSTFKTWQKMLNPAVFYEYSVNRPIYTDKSQIEAFIRTKTNVLQHGYLTIAIKKEDLTSGLTADSLGQTIFKVREGSLKFERFFTFTHNGLDYTLAAGEMIKKT